MDGCFGVIEQHGVIVHQFHIRTYLLLRVVLIVLQLELNRPQIHGSFHHGGVDGEGGEVHGLVEHLLGVF